MDVRKAFGWFLFLTFLAVFGVFGQSCKSETIANIHGLKATLFSLVK
jgi:hypothetical protein